MGSPFDSGKPLIFKSLSDGGPKRYLDSWPGASVIGERVYLSDSTDYNTRRGTHFQAFKLSDGAYSLRSMSSGSKRYLDSWPTAPKNSDTVYLSESTEADKRIGTHWIPLKLGDGTYALQSKSTSGPKIYLDSWPTSSDIKETVYLSDSTDPGKRIGTHWMVGVDWYTGREVQDILSVNYPEVNIQLYKADAKYRAMEYHVLKTIWDNSGLDDFEWKREKFDCDDFAICYKAEVAKWCYRTEASIPDACLCGIIWGKRTTPAGQQEGHAFNFSVDPFGKLILIEPQTGNTIPTDEWTPTFCMC